MKVSKLVKMSDDELFSLAAEKCIDVSSGRDFVIHALSTYPELDDESATKYVEDAAVGMIVAFREEDFHVRSAKIIKKSTKNRKFMLQTKYGRTFFVSFDDIIWVNTNGYWPRWVYNLMKENENAEAYAG